jgi:hypothetical protein
MNGKYCVCCRKNKIDVRLMRFSKKILPICPSCKEELKWTRRCLGVSASNLEVRGKWHKVSDFYVYL